MDPRHQLLTFLFAHTHRPYAWFKRKTPWNLSPMELCACFPEGSLGHVLGHYLLERDFELMPKLESHDVAHLLTGVDTDVPGEIELQFLLFGNGKRSAYLLGVLLAGLLLFPGSWGRWKQAVKRGRHLERFFDTDFRPLLQHPFAPLSSAAPASPHQAA